MKLRVGKSNEGQTTINPITKVIEVLKDGAWVPVNEAQAASPIQHNMQIGIFEPIEIGKDKLSEVLMILNAEKINYQYRVERQGNKYFLI